MSSETKTRAQQAIAYANIDGLSATFQTLAQHFSKKEEEEDTTLNDTFEHAVIFAFTRYDLRPLLTLQNANDEPNIAEDIKTFVGYAKKHNNNLLRSKNI